MVRLLQRRLIAERRGDRQSDCHYDCEEPYASRSGKTSGPEHKQDARVAYLQLVQERVAFDNDKRESRSPEAEAHEPAAHATR
jgi:hypothetical protein